MARAATPLNMLLPVLSVPVLLTAAAPAHDAFRLQAESRRLEEHACSGYDEEYGECPDLKPCEEHIVVKDCKWDEWGDWYDVGGCSQIEYQQRDIKQANNEHGKPCSGEKIRTRENKKEECVKTQRDCKLSEWNEWEACVESVAGEQRTRSRFVEVEPTYAGKACNETLKETKPCAQQVKPTPCQFVEWHEWTECSAKCGKGHQHQSRHVDVEAQHGGAGCVGALERYRDCPDLEPCESQDCEFNDWSDWFPGCRSDVKQVSRSRNIKRRAAGGGAQCSGNMKELKACPNQEPKACEVSDWSGWTTCTVSCGGGQKTKSRRLLNEPVANGGCNETILKVVASCNTDECATVDKDAELGEWGSWSSCDNKCGNGTQTRTRQVVSLAVRYGDGADATVEEVRPCFGNDGENCGPVDCEWGDWFEWSGCTCDCGGGTKRRTRSIKTSPRHGGKACEALVSGEVKACNTQSCDADTCKDGLWHEWGDWGSCSSDCGGGYRVRRRHVKQQPDSCGRALQGNTTEYSACVDLPACQKNQDCKTSEWSEWSSCSCTCFGHKERHKVVSQFAQGGGKPCVEGLREFVPCNPGYEEDPSSACGGAKKQDCILSEWEDWSECSRTCGNGQHKRTRSVKQEATGGGEPCNSTLVVIEGCNSHPCEKKIVIDCEWTDWSSWSDCTKCGGQKSRHREVKTLPNSLGKQCDPDTPAKEVTDCPSDCEETLFCSWTDWSNLDTCDQGCGPGSESRSRSLGFTMNKPPNGGGFFFQGNKGDRCSGLESVYNVCNRSACERDVVDCEFGDWSDWHACSCSGLQERVREITRSNTHGGKPCSGHLSETKTCSVNCDEPVKCELGDWTVWSDCASPHGQSFRTRDIHTPSTNNGDACKGEMKETQACSPRQPEQPCQLHDWSEWGPCSAKCGGGTHTRSRAVVKQPSNGGGVCSGPLEVLEMCNTHECETHQQDCVFGDWEDWSACLHSQRTARRKIKQEAEDGGNACEGELEKTEACGSTDVDCKFSSWTDWGACSAVCGGGQKTRERQIFKHSEGAGEACPVVLKETATCAEADCDFDDCEVEDWSDWSECSAECGEGQVTRERGIKSVRARGGLGCNQTLKETKKCESKPCGVQDCEWDDWSQWSDCSCKCGGGQMTRNRHISKSPHSGGKACDPRDKEQVVPCNTQECPEKKAECIDGTWGEWSAWSSCSAECGGGTRTRTRSADTMANACGEPAEGDSHQLGFCNLDPCEKDVDCKLSHWTDWSDCSDPCDGIKRRSRQIQEYGRGNGKYCEGGMKETAPCNLPSETEGCASEVVDCKMGDWRGWTECPVECGGGQIYNEREIEVPAKKGGRPCNETLQIVKPCKAQPCEKPVDCEFGDWLEWEACGKCSGQRKRRRSVVHYPSHGGKECDYAATSETAACPRKCHEKTYCVWSDWKDWGECSRSCDTGKRSRKRHLTLTTKKPDELLADTANLTSLSMIKKLDALSADVADDHGRFKALGISFASGGLTLVVGMLAMRAFSAFRSSVQVFERESYTQMVSGTASSRPAPVADAEQPLIVDDAA